MARARRTIPIARPALAPGDRLWFCGTSEGVDVGVAAEMLVDETEVLAINGESCGMGLVEIWELS